MPVRQRTVGQQARADPVQRVEAVQRPVQRGREAFLLCGDARVVTLSRRSRLGGAADRRL
jgi:hypothetical protein